MVITKNNWWQIVDEVHSHENAENEPVWKCVRYYYKICTESLVNPLATALLSKFKELAAPIETTIGNFPYDPFPKQDYWKIDEYPVVAIEGFKVIQEELNLVISFKAKNFQEDQEIKLRQPPKTKIT